MPNTIAKIVTIHYFKSSGKWYCSDEEVEWPADPNHYTKWAPFESIVRLKDMIAICMETPMGPMGYPQMAPKTDFR